MFATLIIDTDTCDTELATFATAAEAFAAIAAAARWMHPTQRLRLLEADGGSWRTRAEMASYYGSDQRASREASATRTGELLRTFPSEGPHPCGERGFILTGDRDLHAHVA